MTPVESPGLQALREWREGLLESGVPEADLPTLADLAYVAEVPGLNRAALKHLPVSRPEALDVYGPGILATLRMAGAIRPPGAAPPAPPAPATSSPPPSSEVPPPPAPVPGTDQPGPGVVYRRRGPRGGRSATGGPRQPDDRAAAAPAGPVREPAEPRDAGEGRLPDPDPTGAADRPPAPAGSGDAPSSGRRSSGSRLRRGGDGPPTGPAPGDSAAPGGGRDAQPSTGGGDGGPGGGGRGSEPPTPGGGGRLAGPPEEPPDQSGFAPFDASAADQQPAGTLITATSPAGGLLLRWQPPAGAAAPVDLYRVVSRDDYPPYAPEAGDLVAVTTATTAADDRPLTAAVRHLQVWVNRGSDEAAARAAQPTQLAAATVVAPPADVELREDHGTVTGTWSVGRGASRVDVVRVPVEEAEAPGYLAHLVVSTDGPALHGYRDTTCTTGREYEYRLFTVVAQSDGELLSEPVVRRVRVAAPLVAVRDLVAVPRADSDRLVDLNWGPVGQAHVVVYRTENPPRPGIDLEEHQDESGLPLAGLPLDRRLQQWSEDSGGRHHLRGIPWPDTWERVHFTPVSLDGQRARVGRTVTLTRTGSIEHPALRQRVDSQLLSFDWPEGAAQVVVHATAPGVPFDERTAPRLGQVDRDFYVARGGLRLDLGEYRRGCDVHLVPVSFQAGRQVTGSPTTVSYEGLVRLRYQYAEEPGRRKGLRWTPGRCLLQVATDWEGSGATLRAVLMHREDRLPLGPGDGEPVWRDEVPAPGREWREVLELPPVRQRGYLRLFVEATTGLEDVPVAVLDPPLGVLWQIGEAP